jgi:hypothetical protein
MPEPQEAAASPVHAPRLELEVPLPEHTGLLAIVQPDGRLDVFGYDCRHHRYLAGRGGRPLLRISGSWDREKGQTRLAHDPRFTMRERDALVRALRRADPAGGRA